MRKETRKERFLASHREVRGSYEQRRGDIDEWGEKDGKSEIWNLAKKGATKVVGSAMDPSNDPAPTL